MTTTTHLVFPHQLRFFLSCQHAACVWITWLASSKCLHEQLWKSNLAASFWDFSYLGCLPPWNVKLNAELKNTAAYAFCAVYTISYPCINYSTSSWLAVQSKALILLAFFGWNAMSQPTGIVYVYIPLLHRLKHLSEGHHRSLPGRPKSCLPHRFRCQSRRTETGLQMQ